MSLLLSVSVMLEGWVKRATSTNREGILIGYDGRKKQLLPWTYEEASNIQLQRVLDQPHEGEGESETL